MLKTNNINWVDFVKNTCKEKGISFRQLSKRVNMSDVGLAKSLVNKTIKLTTLIEISKVLQVDLFQFINSLIYGTNEDFSSLLSFQQNEIEKLEIEIKKNEKYTKALEDINAKTKLLREFKDKEELATFKQFVTVEEKLIKHLNIPRVSGEKIIDFFLEYLAWKEDKGL